MADRTQQYMPLDALAPNPVNPKKHLVEGIKTSFDRFGYVEPVTLDERTGMLISGHGRIETLAAAKQANQSPPDGISVDAEGRWLVPVNRGWASTNDKEASAALVALNRYTETGGWDDQALADLLQNLTEGATSQWDALSGVGYSPDDLSELLERLGAHPYGPNKDPDDVPAVPRTAVSKRGDLWLCGPHRVLCGDATDPESLATLMDGVRADLLWTDPPYGVSYAEKNRFLNAIGRPNSVEEPILGDHQTPEEVEVLWRAVFTVCRHHLAAGASYYVTGPQGGDLLLLLLSLRDTGYPLRHMLIWAKSNFVLGRSDYNYQHEPIIFGWVEGAHKFYGQPNETSLWEIPKPSASKLHPTMKPVDLVARSLRNSCPPGGTVLDPFAGSGTTLIAAHQTGYHAHLVEKDEPYVDVICRRYQEFTNDRPVLASTGQPHDFTQT